MDILQILGLGTKSDLVAISNGYQTQEHLCSLDLVNKSETSSMSAASLQV